MRLGIARWSIASATDHSFWGDGGIDPLLVLEEENRGIAWFPELLNGV